MKQDLLFTESQFLPRTRPHIRELVPSANLLAVFEDCHNHIYANEGMLKDKIFHEVVKLLLMKLIDERTNKGGQTEFSITEKEHAEISNGQKANEFLARINKLLSVVKEKYPGLFASDGRVNFKPLTLAYVVSRLQHISFLDTPSDIKGQAFQTFVSRYQRGDRGEFFTPHPVVKLMVEFLDPGPNEKVLDPACGSGGFLIQAIQYLKNTCTEVDISEYIRKNVRGIEFNPDIATAATVRLAFEGGTGSEIHYANALGQLTDDWHNFDVILTNPPFGSRGKVEDLNALETFDLAHKWVRTSSSGWTKEKGQLQAQTPEILFIERCVELLKPGGRIGIVLPEGLLQNVSIEYVRKWLWARCEILGVVSLPQETFIPYGTGIKTSALFMRKRLTKQQSDRCFMAKIDRVGYDVKGQAVYKTDNTGKIQRDTSGTPIIDDDINTTVHAYKKFGNAEEFDETDRVFTLSYSEMNSRLDVGHYIPSDRMLIRGLIAQKAKALREIAEIVDESADFRSDASTPIRYVAISDIDYRTMRIVSEETMRAHEAPSRATYKLRAGDIITAISGASTGTEKHATAYVTEEHDGTICSNGLAVIRNIKGVDPFYLLGYMRTNYFLKQVRRLLTGHAIPAVSIEEFSGVLVPIPSVREQKELARSYIEIRNMQNEVYQKVRGLSDRVGSLLGKILEGQPD